MSGPEKRRDLPIVVSRHAREQARARFPGFKTARIIDEVREAFASGRFSTSKPRGLMPPDDPIGMYAWTEKGDRVYAIRTSTYTYTVTTTMKPTLEDG